MNATRLIQLVLCALVTPSYVHADIFDQWAEQHNSGQDINITADGIETPHIWMVPGKMEIVKRQWDGRSGIAMVFYIYGNGRRVQRVWIAADVNEQGKASFVAWTPNLPAKGFAKYGQAADVATTSAGLAVGLAEVNPLLGSTPVLAAAALVKVAAVPALRRHSIGACYRNIGPLGDVGWAATGWNLAAIAGMGPAGVIPAIAVAVAMHPDVNEQFWSCVPQMTPNLGPESHASPVADQGRNRAGT